MSRKAVFDAMVFLQAGANPTGPSGACFARVRSGTLADLLDLMQDPDFTTRFPGIRVLDPVSLLREIELEREDDQVRRT